MNANRRKRIAEAAQKLREVEAEVQSLAEEEREAFDNLPESIQQSERGQAMEEAAEVLEEQAGNLGDTADALEEDTSK